MFDGNGTRSSRQLAIADHLWETLETMSREMGTPVEALVNQAIFALARSHGYAGAAPPLPVPRTAPRAAATPSTPSTPSTPPAPRPAAAPPPLRTPAAPVARAAGRARHLEIHDDHGRVVPVASERFVIGRGRECHLVVDSSSISREHAAIVRTKDGWFIEDLGSANGTWFHKKRVERQRIEDGDEYFLSAERLRFLVR